MYPVTWSDRNSLLQPGATAELYLRPEQAEVRQGLVYGPDGRVAEHDGRLCAVLGAGNHVSGGGREEGWGWWGVEELGMLGRCEGLWGDG